MTLALSWTDNLNATATATITGSDVASTNTVYVSPVNQTTRPLAWSSAGSRTGDGAITLAISPGYWFAYCLGTVSSVQVAAAPLIGSVSLASDAIQTLAERAIQARIQALCPLTALATPPGDLPSAQVYHWDAFTAAQLEKMTYPAIAVSPAPLAETVGTILTGRDDIGYPVYATILVRCSPLDQGPVPTVKLWRQAIFRAIRFQPLVLTGTVYTVKPEPREILEWVTPKYQLLYSTLGFRAISREPRG